MFTENFFKNTVEKYTRERIAAESLAVELALTELIKAGKVSIEMHCDVLGGDIINMPSWNYQAFISFPGHDTETKMLRSIVDEKQLEIERLREQLLKADLEVSKLQECHRENVDKVFALNSQINNLQKTVTDVQDNLTEAYRELRTERDIIDKLAEHKAYPLIKMAKEQQQKRLVKL